MIRRLGFWAAAIAALSLLPLQASEDWSAVRALAKGTALHVEREDGQSFKGSLTEVTENHLEISTGGGTQQFGRSTTRVVKVKSSGSRARNAAIGAAIAGGAVAAGMSLICASCFGERDNYKSTVVAVSLAAAGGGAVVGWLLPGYKTVYKAPKARKR